ncbi:hypothetical protein [Desulfobacter postgatei]|uniref:hypothetical protein n=1 Tax=Desulfobacter postgatei TaxID=2293 RepID=UPI00259B6373|nr:hypothetical protein [uncultured Desulfobacter sp.]
MYQIKAFSGEEGEAIDLDGIQAGLAGHVRDIYFYSEKTNLSSIFQWHRAVQSADTFDPQYTCVFHTGNVQYRLEMGPCFADQGLGTWVVAQDST